jgi:hypothetical protein
VATPAPPPKRKLIEHPWRVAIVVIALVAVLNLGILLIRTSDTSVPGATPPPESVESVSPQPSEITGLVDDVSADLADNLTGVLVINGTEIPEDQVSRVEELGIITFRPGPGKDITAFPAGVNTVVVEYWEQGKERPAHPAVYTWHFTAAA